MAPCAAAPSSPLPKLTAATWRKPSVNSRNGPTTLSMSTFDQRCVLLTCENIAPRAEYQGPAGVYGMPDAPLSAVVTKCTTIIAAAMESVTRGGRRDRGFLRMLCQYWRIASWLTTTEERRRKVRFARKKAMPPIASMSNTDFERDGMSTSEWKARRCVLCVWLLGTRAYEYCALNM